MSLVELVLISLSLSLDAMTVSVGAGVLNRMNVTRSVYVAGVLGLFHGLFLLIGRGIGASFPASLLSYGSYIGFALIVLVAGKMLWDSFRSEDVEDEQNILHLKSLLVLAFAVSIDAFVMGITFTFIAVDIARASLVIGGVVFLMSLLGIYLGTKSKHLIGMKIERVGALVLILLAFKILLF